MAIIDDGAGRHVGRRGHAAPDPAAGPQGFQATCYRVVDLTATGVPERGDDGAAPPASPPPEPAATELTSNDAAADGRGPGAGGGVASRSRSAGRFALVGASGLVVNQLALWLGVEQAHLHYLLGAVAATQASTTWNFLLTERFVFPRRGGSVISRFLAFAAVNNSTLLARVPLLAVLTGVVGLHYLLANLVSLGLLFASRFVASDRLIWRDGAAAGEPGHRYDVGGIVTIESEVPLRELAYFQAAATARPADIVVRRGAVGRRRPRRRPVVTHAPGFVAYEEHLGRWGANFRIDFSAERIDVTVGPLLACSPHVVYTNVVEALLRFVLVSRGHILLHSATIELDGRGVMLTARTDTGKTGTVLRLLRERAGAFLSDDMTIVGPGGVARCYPKPLTISAHTLRAVNRRALGPRERARLALQSRLHSKGGRALGSRLAALNLPIMALNAATQALVPPPKYMVDRLVPCRCAGATTVRDLFVIERGARALEEVDHARAVEVMLENTDDAYGFPPFRYFAPAIEIAGQGYHALRERERELLASFLLGVRVRRLARDDFSWADAIPELAAGPGGLGPAGSDAPEAGPDRDRVA